jgi:hypothetical protein
MMVIARSFLVVIEITSFSCLQNSLVHHAFAVVLHEFSVRYYGVWLEYIGVSFLYLFGLLLSTRDVLRVFAEWELCQSVDSTKFVGPLSFFQLLPCGPAFIVNDKG